MGRFNTYIILCSYLIVYIVSSGCQNDDDSTETIIAHEHDIAIVHRININEFPEILDHVASVTREDFRVQIDHSTNPNIPQSRNHERITNLILDLENATQNTDENGRSNYVISAKAETTNTHSDFKFATYKLVVVEYGETEYSFILEREYDQDWIASQADPLNWNDETFTGAIRFYNIYGYFVAETQYSGGIVINQMRGADPCGGDDPGDGDPGDGDGGDGGGGYYICGCNPGHLGGNDNPDCVCTLPDVWIATMLPVEGDVNKDPLRGADPCGPSGGGSGDNGGGNDDIPDLPEECFLPNGDPIDCENPDIPLTNEQLLENYFSLLVILGDNIPDFWTIHMDKSLWLGDNKPIASEMLYYLVEQNYSGSSIDFVMEALDSLMNGGEVSFDENLIIDPSVSDCVQSIIDPLITKSDFVSLVPNVPINTNLSSLILDLFSNSSNHNLKIEVGSLSSGVNAETVPSSQGGGHFLYTTTINSSYINNATDLAIARTVIHESVHAYLSYIYHDQPFSSISVILRHHLSQNGATTNTAQHEFMVQYVDAVAYSLQNWDNNGLGSIDYYKYLAWSGDMLNTTDFDQLPTAFKSNVISANIAEGQAGPGNGSTNAALGTNNCQ